MKKIATYFLLGLLVFSSCKSEKKTTASHAGTSENAEPEALRPQVDLRFQEKFFEAQKQKALGNIDLAYKAFMECLVLEPTNGAVNYEVARIEANKNQNISRAAELALIAVKSDLQNPWYHKLLGDLYMELAKTDLAIKEYKEVVRLQPGSQSETDLVYALVVAGKTKEAIALYDANEKKFGVSEETALQKHQLYLQLEDYEKAGLELEKLAYAFPKNADYWGMVIGFYQDIKNPEKAKAAFEELKKCDVENGRLHLQLSEYLSTTGEDEKSFEELILAFESYDVLIDEKIAFLMRFFSIPRPNELVNKRAYRLLDIVVELHPGEAKAYAIYGDFLYRDQRFSEAAVKYRRAVQVDPSRHVIWAQLLDIEQRSQDFVSMKSESASALELFPGMPEFYLYNGMANIRLGFTEEALESLSIGKELVIEDDQMLSRFHALLGDVYHDKKQHDKSDEHFEQAIRLSPDNLGFLNNYAYYLALRKTKLEKAAEMAKMCVTREPSNTMFQDTYAWVLFKQAKYPESLGWMEKSIQATPNPGGEQLEHYGDILFMNGRANDALVQWRIALPLKGASISLAEKIAQQKMIE